MQDFAPGKAAICIALHQLNCFTKKYRTTVRIMKLTAIILLAACLQLSAKGVSQTITLSLKDAPIQTVFKEIERQTEYTFFADVRWFQMAKKVTIEVKSLPLNQVLNLCFKDQPFTYSISGKTITLAPKKKQVDKDSQTSVSQKPVIDVKGRVVNSKGEPVTDATVTVQGTNQRTVTNTNGEFTLTGINGDALIVISHVQYEAENISLNGLSIVNATLQIKVNNLDELQVIAYGSTTKRFNTGNVSTVKAIDIEKQPVNNPLLALEGRVPGLFITQSTGFPGAGVGVRIQGQNSIGKGNDPLYVIDGMPYVSQLLPSLTNILGRSNDNISGGGATTAGNPLNFINPSDIESIDVLKDADATAIYGSRAANGAILITTKKGKAGQTRININIQNGWGIVSRKLDLLNTQQYLEMRKEAINNDGLTPNPDADFDLTLWDTTRNTDWQKVLLGGTANYQDIQTSVSGGTTNTQILVGAGYHKETTVLPGNLSDEKGSLHFNLNNVSSNQKFRLSLSGNYLVDNNRLIYNDLTETAINLAPNAPSLFNPDGTLNWEQSPNGISTWFNPLAYLNKKYRNKTNNLISNATLSYQILPEINLKSSFGYTSLQSSEIVLFPLTSIEPENRPFSNRASTFGNNSISSWIIEPQINYHKEVKIGTLDVLLGMSIQKINSNQTQLIGLGFNSDAVMEDVKSAPIVRITSSINSVYKYNAGFGRINYNLYNKYILNLTFRRDGSSRFGSSNQFHNFWSLGGAWIFTNYKFIKDKLSFLSFGKIKGSYGTTGNDQIGDYQFLNQYSVVGADMSYQNSIGLLPNGLTNPHLQWEETQKLNIGIDLGVNNDRILVNANYFQNRSSNQLLFYQLGITSGASGLLRNFPATVQNSGWEFSLNTSNFKGKNFTWSSTINLTIPKNKLVSFSELDKSSYVNRFVIGETINLSKAYKFLGVDPTTGKYSFEDGKGGSTFRPDTTQDVTRNAHINPMPNVYGGFQNSFQYNGFTIDILFQFVKQKGRSNKFGIYPGSGNGIGGLNQPISILSRWQKPGDITDIQRFNADFSLSDQYSAATASDFAWEDASYVRLKNVSISWQVPDRWRQKARLNNARIYVQGQNLATITKYSGIDPENLSLTTLPPLRVWTIGLQMGL